METVGEISEYLSKHPIKHYKDGFHCLMDCKNIIDALRGAGLITIATIELIPGPLVIAGKNMLHHAVVHVYKPIDIKIDPTNVVK